MVSMSRAAILLSAAAMPIAAMLAHQPPLGATVRLDVRA